MKIPVLLAISLASAIGGLLFLSGSMNFAVLGAGLYGRDNAPQAEAAILPLQVVDRFTQIQMEGDGESGSNMKVEEDFVDPENHCEFCTRVEYIPGSKGVTGFAYASDEALDLTGAKKIRFWVMGEEGGEKVKFMVAGTKKNLDAGQTRDSLGIFNTEIFARTSKEVTLKDDWTKYELDLHRIDLSGITHPFGLELTKGSDEKSQVVYIKGIVFENEPLRPGNALEAITEETGVSLEIMSKGTLSYTIG
ncbi:MAG TPA: hypothetical protein VGQ03_08460 [Nitrososphaera sp.]|nr:hypothetical protein [Nitrososphaera sp.]